ncbi:MAG: D-xylose transport system substrate-binding protein [Actinomycetota bacterium]|jgi:D-xylose transport system substrate-binding protein|nr:D-xylose transport system substrate-binding protein [Actinomycetota bacterium]MDQ1666299.1 D-xylose transport system substrate-binding protein [Actinomycetota bacterium]
MRMRNIAVAGLVVMPLLLTACGGGSGGSATSGSSSSGSSSSAKAGGKVGVILPDASTSPRWENNDRPALQKAIVAAGYEAVIQNAGKDVGKFSQLCDSMINQSVNVLLIVNLDSESGAACEKKAKDAGIASIDYDRLTLGGSADYYVSFDNVEVGKLMGDGLVKCLDDAGKTKANIVEINGDPTDNNAALFKQGYDGALKPKVDSGDYKIVADQTGKWDATVAQTTFEQGFTQNNGKVDGVISANDTMAGGIVTVLKNNNLAGKVPVTGQDASDEGLQRVIAGTQCGTVFKDVNLEADAAAKLAIAILKNDGSAAALVNGEVDDTQAKKKVKSVFAKPVWITQENIKAPFDAGYTTVEKVCTADFAAACAKLGLS